LELASFRALSGHPKMGTSFEGFVIEQIITRLNTRNASFWATHAGAELDLLLNVSGMRYGIEVKYSDAPGTTRSMRVALKDLDLAHLWVVYPGSEAYQLDDRISVMPVDKLPVFQLSE
jgi:predicted AAA+ superfamily ATPase